MPAQVAAKKAALEQFRARAPRGLQNFEQSQALQTTSAEAGNCDFDALMYQRLDATLDE